MNTQLTSDSWEALFIITNTCPRWTGFYPVRVPYAVHTLLSDERGSRCNLSPSKFKWASWKHVLFWIPASHNEGCCPPLPGYGFVEPNMVLYVELGQGPTYNDLNVDAVVILHATPWSKEHLGGIWLDIVIRNAYSRIRPEVLLCWSSTQILFCLTLSLSTISRHLDIAKVHLWMLLHKFL